MRVERNRVAALMQLGLDVQQAVYVIGNPALSQKMGPPEQLVRGALVSVEQLGLIFDASDRLEDSHAILWWNDLKKDRRYRSWPADINEVCPISIVSHCADFCK